MAHGKIAQLRWGAFDNFEDYGSDATLALHWVESGTAAELALATPAVGIDQKYEGRRSLKLVLSNSSGSTQLYKIARTFTGLAPSTSYSIEVRLRRTAATGTPVIWSTTGELTMTTPADNAWGLSGVLTASSDASGNLIVRLEVRSLANGASVTYWFDEVRVWRSVSIGWPLEAPINYPRPKPGYKRVRTKYGIEDVWDQGHDQLVRARVRWIPPQNVTGPTATGFNATGGFREFLEYANGGRVFQFVPDVLVASYYNVRLLEPIQDPPGIEVDVTRSYELVMRSIDDTPIAVY